jgi:hypothetical protein
LINQFLAEMDAMSAKMKDCSFSAQPTRRGISIRRFAGPAGSIGFCSFRHRTKTRDALSSKCSRAANR